MRQTIKSTKMKFIEAFIHLILIVKADKKKDPVFKEIKLL